MTVKELIKHLEKHDGKLMAVIGDYEGGETEVSEVGIIDVVLNANNKWYYGEHEEVIGKKLTNSVKVLKIS